MGVGNAGGGKGSRVVRGRNGCLVACEKGVGTEGVGG